MNPLHSVNANGLNHDQSRGRGVRGRTGEEVPERRDDEDRESEVLDREQHVLDALAELDAAPADPGHEGDEDDARRRHERHVLRKQRVLGAAHDRVDGSPEVGAGDLREVGEHDYAGQRHAPAAHPPYPGAERLGRPGERRPAVGYLVVQLAVGEGDEQHRHERDDERDGGLCADGEHHEAQRGHDRVDGSGGSEPDDRRSPEAERSRREALALWSLHVNGRRRSHP